MSFLGLPGCSAEQLFMHCSFLPLKQNYNILDILGAVFKPFRHCRNTTFICNCCVCFMCSLFRCSGQGRVVYSMWALKNTHVYSRNSDQTPIDQAIYSLFLNYFPLSSYSECYWKAWVLLPLGDYSSCVCRIIWISIWSASKKRGQFLPSASSWAFLPQSLSLLVAAPLQRALCSQVLMEAEE